MKFSARFARKLSAALLLAGALFLSIGFSAPAIAASALQNPDFSIKIEVPGYDEANKPSFYNFKDETTSINPQLKNTGKYSASVEMSVTSNLLGADSVQAFYTDNINSAWSLKSSSVDAERSTFTATYVLNHKLEAGKTSEKLFSEVYAHDNFTLTDIEDMQDEITINYSASADFEVPSAPSHEDEPSENIVVPGTDSKTILPNTGDSTSTIAISIGVAFLAFSAMLFALSKHMKASHGAHYNNRGSNNKAFFIVVASLFLALAPVAITNAVAVTQTKASVNIEIKLSVDKTTYKVDFDMNNADTTSFTSLDVPKNTTLQSVEDPSREGYTFTEWTSQDAPFEFEVDRIVDDTTLVANFKINQYTLSFNKGEHGVQDVPVSRTLDFASALGEKPTLTEDGWYLIGWCTDSDCTHQIDWDSYKMPAYDATLYALWGETWAVSFNTFGRAQAPSPITKVQDQSRLTEAQKPTVSTPGFTFDGWYKDRDLTTPFAFGDAGTQVTDNIELYAKWIAKTDTPYAVKHWFQNVDNNNYYAVNSLQDDLTGTTETQASAATKVVEGFENIPSKTRYQDSKVTTPKKDELTISGDGSLVVNLYYDREIKTVTFSANGHGSSPSSQSLRYGAHVKCPAAPLSQGYNFDGWYTDEACTTPFGFDSEVVGAVDITLYAKWSPAGDTSYKVNYYLQNLEDDNYTLKESANRKGTTDSVGSFDTKSYSGFSYAPTQIKYSDSSHASQSDVLSVASDGTLEINLYYTRDKHSVSFDTNGYGIKPNAQNDIKFGGHATQPASPHVTGYTFGGFYKTRDCSESSKWDFDTDTIGTSDITLYEKWTINTHTLSFNKNGHGEDAQVPSSQSVNFDEGANPVANLSESGWLQIGWATDEAGTNRVYFDTFKMPDADVTFYAVWIKTYYIDFRMNGKGDQVPLIQGIDAGTKVSADNIPQDPTSAGYTFKGWYTDPTFTESSKFDFQTTTVNKNYTLYAKWEPSTNTAYTVNVYKQNLDGNYDNVTPTVKNLTGTTESTIAPASLKETITGFTFNSADTTYSDTAHASPQSQTLPVAADGSLVINLFYQRNFHNVTFNHQGKGGPNTSVQNVKFGASLTNPGTLSHTGYNHNGKWYKEAACTTEFNFATDTMPDADLTLFAKWSANTYTVHFDGNGATSGSINDETLTFDAAASLTSNAFTKTGYTFKGWAKSSSATTADYTNTASVTNLIAAPNSAGTSSITLYAVWRINTPTYAWIAKVSNPKSPIQDDQGNLLIDEEITNFSSRAKNNSDTQQWIKTNILAKECGSNGTIGTDAVHLYVCLDNKTFADFSNNTSSNNFCEARLIGLNHTGDGGSLTWQSVACVGRDINTYNSMYNTNSNLNGYAEMTTNYIRTMLAVNGAIYNRFNSNFMNSIKETTKVCNGGYQTNHYDLTKHNITAKLWLLSFNEITPEGTWRSIHSSYENMGYEGTQYELFKNYTPSINWNSSNSKLLVKQNRSGGTACWWWLRTADPGSSTGFQYVEDSGKLGRGQGVAGSSWGVAPCFSI